MIFWKQEKQPIQQISTPVPEHFQEAVNAETQWFSQKNNEKLGKVPKNTSISPVLITVEKNGKEKNPIDEILKSKKCVFFQLKNAYYLTRNSHIRKSFRSK